MLWLSLLFSYSFYTPFEAKDTSAYGKCECVTQSLCKKKSYYVLGYAVKIWAIYYVHNIPNNKVRIENYAVKKNETKTNMLQ